MNSVNQPTTRLYYLDWLRVLAMFGVFFYHNARFFDELTDWHVKNATTNLAATVYIAFVSQWGMPLFFLLAGAGTYFALRNTTLWQYALDRTLRLLVRLLFGMLVIVVPQAYFEAIYQGETISGNFLQIYAQYLKTLPELPWYHLWFLADLFIISIVALLVFIPIGKSKENIIARISYVFKRPLVMIIVLILLLTAIDAFIYPSGFWGNRNNAWSIAGYAVFFIAGYLIFADRRVMETIRKLGWITLGTGIVACTCLVVFFIEELSHPVDYFGTLSYLLAQFVQAVNTWSWLFFILGIASRYLTGTNKFLRYANEAVLPFYILHQTIIIVIGFYVVQWNTNIGVKFLTIMTTSFIAIMLIYEFLVKRFNILRFLLGMRPKRRTLIVD
jgi:glucan biosynthesis protein C